MTKPANVSTTKPASRFAKPCKGVSKRTGEPCQGFCVAGSDYCLAHDPTRAGERAKYRRQGGKARHGQSVEPPNGYKPMQLESIADVIGLLNRAINDTLALPNGVNRNRTLGTLSGSIIEAFKVGDLESEIAAMKAILRERGLMK